MYEKSFKIVQQSKTAELTGFPIKDNRALKMLMIDQPKYFGILSLKTTNNTKN